MVSESREDRIRELEARLRDLEGERDQLRFQSKKVAEANARAAIEMASRNVELEQQRGSLEEALEDARLASAKKDEFLGKVSHELRTPLNGVLGMLDFLIDTELSEDQADFATTASESATSLLAIINDLLDFSRIAGTELRPLNERFDAWRLIEDVVRLLAVPAREHGLRLESVIEPSMPRFLEGDPGRLRQVLINLCGNAIKFTDVGSVTLRAGPGDRAGDVFLDVQDTGRGFEACEAARLFEPFEQVDNSATREHGGIGLGLAISKELVEAMGGTINATSEVGAGSTFRVQLAGAIAAEAGGSAKAYDSCFALVEDVGLLAALRGHAEAVGVGLRYCGSLEELRDAEAEATGGRVLCLLEVDALSGDDRELLESGEHGVRGLILLARYDDGVLTKTQARSVLRLPLRVSELHLLLTQGTLVRASSKPKSVEREFEGLEVLLVEDNPVNQRVGKLMLEREGCRVTLAADGHGCVESLSASEPRVIFMDCQMPVMDGYEATKIIRARGGRAGQTPIVALTAHASEEDRRRCLASGMDDYLTKPIDARALKRILRRWSGDASGWEPEREAG